jgi:hypothetical protein
MFRLQTPTIKTRAASQHINHPLLTHLHPIRLIVHVAHHFTNSVKRRIMFNASRSRASLFSVKMALNISSESAPFCKMATLLNKKFSKATTIRRQMGARALPRIERFFSTQNPKNPSTLQMRRKSLAPRVSDHRAFFGNYPVYKKKVTDKQRTKGNNPDVRRKQFRYHRS